MLKKARLSFHKVDIYVPAAADVRDPGPRGPTGGVERDRDGRRKAWGWTRREATKRPWVRQVPGDRRLGLSVFPTDRGDYLGFVRERRPPGPGDPREDRLRFPACDSFKKSMRWADLDVKFARPVPLDRLAVRRRGPSVFVRRRHGGADDVRAPLPAPGPSSFLDHRIPRAARGGRVLVDLDDGRGGSARESGRRKSGSA